MVQVSEKTTWFDFHDWRKAFHQYYLLKDTHQLVISVHPVTSGYWLELKGENCTPGEHYLYDTEEKVRDLEKRIVNKDYSESRGKVIGNIIL